MDTKSRNKLIENLRDANSDDSVEMILALEVLTGYVESMVRNGDGGAPKEWAKIARRLIRKMRG